MSTTGAEELRDELRQGLAQLRAGRYFEAHESFEVCWREAAPSERDFFQGLVHVAVAWYQAGRGNRVGCERQLAKATRRLAAFSPVYRDTDVDLLLSRVEAARRLLEAGSLELPTLSDLAG